MVAGVLSGGIDTHGHKSTKNFDPVYSRSLPSLRLRPCSRAGRIYDDLANTNLLSRVVAFFICLSAIVVNPIGRILGVDHANAPRLEMSCNLPPCFLRTFHDDGNVDSFYGVSARCGTGIRRIRRTRTAVRRAGGRDTIIDSHQEVGELAAVGPTIL